MGFTPLEPGSVEFAWRQDMRDRFRSQQEAAAVLKIPLLRLQKAWRGDLDALTCGDWYKIRGIISEPVRENLARRYFWIEGRERDGTRIVD